MSKKIDWGKFKKEREMRKDTFTVVKQEFPWLFDILGNLKSMYRNKQCVCGSRQKMKFCHGIKYI